MHDDDEDDTEEENVEAVDLNMMRTAEKVDEEDMSGEDAEGGGEYSALEGEDEEEEEEEVEEEEEEEDEDRGGFVTPLKSRGGRGKGGVKTAAWKRVGRDKKENRAKKRGEADVRAEEGLDGVCVCAGVSEFVCVCVCRIQVYIQSALFLARSLCLVRATFFCSLACSRSLLSLLSLSPPPFIFFTITHTQRSCSLYHANTGERLAPDTSNTDTRRASTYTLTAHQTSHTTHTHTKRRGVAIRASATSSECARGSCR